MCEDDLQKLAQQVFEHAGIQLIDRDRGRGFVERLDEQMQYRDNLLDAFGLVFERNLLRILERNKLNQHPCRSVRQQLVADILEGDGQAGHELAKHDVHVLDQNLRRIKGFLRDKAVLVERKKYRTC